MPELIFTDEDDRRVAAIVARTTGYVEQRFDELADALPADVHSELLDAARAYIGRYVDCNLAVRAVVDRLVSRFGGEFPDLGDIFKQAVELTACIPDTKPLVFALRNRGSLPSDVESAGKDDFEVALWDVLLDCEDFSRRVAEAAGIPHVAGLKDYES
jgi:phage FluMu gp28-like protein